MQLAAEHCHHLSPAPGSLEQLSLSCVAFYLFVRPGVADLRAAVGRDGRSSLSGSPGGSSEQDSWEGSEGITLSLSFSLSLFIHSDFHSKLKTEDKKKSNVNKNFMWNPKLYYFV